MTVDALVGLEDDRVERSGLRVAVVLDRPAFQAALELVLRGIDAPNGYTEPVLHNWRRMVERERAAIARPRRRVAADVVEPPQSAKWSPEG
jgi:hypothetical protein